MSSNEWITNAGISVCHCFLIFQRYYLITVLIHTIVVYRNICRMRCTFRPTARSIHSTHTDRWMARDESSYYASYYSRHAVRAVQQLLYHRIVRPSLLLPLPLPLISSVSSNSSIQNWIRFNAATLSPSVGSSVCTNILKVNHPGSTTISCDLMYAFDSYQLQAKYSMRCYCVTC